MLVVVLNDWVIDTNDDAGLVERFDQFGNRAAKRVSRSTHDSDVDALAAMSLSKRCSAGRSSVRSTAIVVHLSVRVQPSLAWDNPGCRRHRPRVASRLLNPLQTLLIDLRIYGSHSARSSPQSAASQTKDAGPDQRVPVIARATSDNERHSRSFQCYGAVLRNGDHMHHAVPFPDQPHAGARRLVSVLADASCVRTLPGGQDSLSARLQFVSKGQAQRAWADRTGANVTSTQRSRSALTTAPGSAGLLSVAITRRSIR
jgi:hypothetical protein